MFKEKLILFNERDYNTAKHNVNNRIKQFENVKIEVEKIAELPTTTEGLNKLLNNPYNYVKEFITKKHITLPFRYEKLLDLLEINTIALELAIKKMDNYKSNIYFNEENQIVSNVKKSDYEIYTKNQAENTKFEKCEKFIELFIEHFGKGFQNGNLHRLVNSTKGMIKYDIYSSTLIPDPNYVKNLV